jgi:hypothetical protein
MKYTKKTVPIWKRITLFVFSFALIAFLIPPQPVAAQECDELFYSSNDVIFFNPCEEFCSVSAETAANLSGSNNAEKIWNYYAGKGLTPVAVAGIMGNFNQESTLDPAVKQNHTTKALPITGDGVTGYGLAQWTYITRQAMLFAKINEAGLAQYLGEGWGASEVNKSMPPEDHDKLLQLELDFSWEGDSTKISELKDQLNATTSVEGNGGSTVIFHNTYENSSDDASQIEERVADARAFLEKYGGGTSGAEPGQAACGAAGALGGVKSIDDGIAWARKYVSDTKMEYGAGGSEVDKTLNWDGGSYKVIYNFGHSGGDCWGGADCGQCVAMSGWFVLNQTADEQFLSNNGGFIVDNYQSAGLPTGTEPRPWSIFSAKSTSEKYGNAGHTGVVLGVLDNGDVITAEVNFDGDGSVGIWQGNLQNRYAGVELEFAYFDDRLSGDAAKVSN